MNTNEIDIMKLTPEDYLKMCERWMELEKKNVELSDMINRMDGGCKRAIELRRLLDELFEIKPNEFVSDDQIRSKMKGLRERCADLEYENNRQACCIYELKNKVSDLTDENTLLKTKIADLTDENGSQRDHIQEVEDALLTLVREAENSAEQIKNLNFCITDVRKSAEKYYDECEAYIRLKNSYRDKCNLLLEEKAGLEKRLRDAEKENDELTKELAKKLYGDPLPRMHYVAYTADTIGYPLRRIMEINREKLQARYSDGKFDAERSRNRKEGDI